MQSHKIMQSTLTNKLSCLHSYKFYCFADLPGQTIYSCINVYLHSLIVVFYFDIKLIIVCLTDRINREEFVLDSRIEKLSII